jgi:hypothetical protein
MRQTDRPSQNVAFQKSEALGYTAAESCSLFHSPHIATAVCSNLRKPRDNQPIHKKWQNITKAKTPVTQSSIRYDFLPKTSAKE